MRRLVTAVERWAKERHLDTADPMIQMVKLMEEAGELAEGLLKGHKYQVIDSIGDCAVVLIILSRQCGLSFEGCLYEAYEQIKNRSGEMRNGVFVKSTDLEELGDSIKGASKQREAEG